VLASKKINETYTPSATSKHSTTLVSTGITPIISIDPTSAAICSITSGVVTFDAIGTCVINADASSDSNYEAGTESQSITVTANSSNSSSIATILAAIIKSNKPALNNLKNVLNNLLNKPVSNTGLTNLPPINSPELKPIFPTRIESVLPNISNPGMAITDNIGRLPKSEPGEKQISVSGNFLPIQEFVTPEGNMGFKIPENTNVAPIEVVLETTRH